MLQFDGTEYRVDYEPAESTTGLFGGNSNWRGPIWLPVNFLMVEALQRFHHYYGDTLTVECPTGSGHHMTLDRVAADLAPPDPHLPARRVRPAARLRPESAIPAGPSLARRAGRRDRAVWRPDPPESRAASQGGGGCEYYRHRAGID